MRNISIDGVRGLLAQETADVWLVLLTISHPDLSDDIRVVNNNVNVSYSGDTYVAFPFKIELPSESEEKASDVTLEIDAVDRTIVQTIRELTTKPTASIRVVRIPAGSSIPVSEVFLENFELSNVSYQALRLQARLGYEENFLAQDATKDTFSKDLFPGAF
jgi:hypothetical protein